MSTATRAHKLEHALLALLLLGFAWILVRSAWLCDDAFITFRSVDHFAQGFGLRFNVAERVQAYTHPLWMALMALTAGLFRNFDLVPLLVSLATSIMAVGILAFRIANGPSSAIVAVLALALSRSFVDYSTSGLENPLSHCLFAAFALLCFGKGDTAAPEMDDRRFVAALGVAGLAILCRMDTILLYAPVLGALFLSRHSKRDLALALIAFSPVLLWEAFSLLYYGFAIPNTAPAKLGAGIAVADSIAQGFAYLRASGSFDPIGVVAIAAGFCVAAVQRDRSSLIALGVLLYLTYVVRIGGDFMVGRHLSLPIFASLVLVARYLPQRRPVWTVAAASLIALALLTPRPTISSDTWLHEGGEIFEAGGVKDERSVYAPYSARWSGFPLREHPWAQQGRAASQRGPAVIPKVAIGLFAFHAGPEVHVVDANALSDPLLARLPARAGSLRIGHATRDLPEGYLESLRRGQNQIVDPAIADFYDELLLLTRADLFSSERLRTIGRFLFGDGTPASD